MSLRRWFHRRRRAIRLAGGGAPSPANLEPFQWWNGAQGVTTNGSGNVTAWADQIEGNIAVPRSVPPAYDSEGGFIYVPDESVAANHEKLISNQDAGAPSNDYRFLIDGSGDGVTVWLRLRFRLGSAASDYVAGLDDFGSNTLYFNRNNASTLQAVHQRGSFTAVSTTGIQANTIHDVFLTVDPSTAGTPQMSIYLDSTTPAQTANVSGFYTGVNGLNDFGIGGTAQPGSNESSAEADFFQVALWKKVLTTDDLQFLIDWLP